MKPDNIRAALDHVLPGVQKPGRYLGLETNRTIKEWNRVEVRVLLAFPNEYGIGMSHYGTRMLYHIGNLRNDALVERAFAPWPDMASAMRLAGVPLYSLESYHAATDFDIIGITLQSELDYTNLPYLLDLAGIPRRASERTDKHPLVVAGGPCTANPEPVADFFDAVAIGDGEILLPSLIETVKHAKRAGVNRIDLLREVARQPGWYVPQFYRWQPAESPGAGGSFEVIDPVAPERVKREWVGTLDPTHVPVRPLVPAVDVVQNRLGLEITRGCTRGCRFCQAGFWYRPVREHEPEVIKGILRNHVDASGCEEVGLLSLSSADYSQIESLATELATELAARRVSLSLPSLRADAFGVGLADAVSRVRKSSFTFAPETGSERLRRVLNKTLTNSDMINAAEVAFARGWNLIKIYAMVGLPTETEEDVTALIDLAADILAAARRVGNRRAEVKVAVSPFIPKAWTPFQWAPFLPVAEIEHRISLLRDGFRRLRHANLTWADPSTSALEAMLSRGDRRFADVICRAHDLGAVFDGWGECLNLPAWQQAITEFHIVTDAELGPRELVATLPWEIVDPGVTKRFLRAEWRRAQFGHTAPDCRWGRCLQCGLPGQGKDIRLAKPRPAVLPVAISQNHVSATSGAPLDNQQPKGRVRLRLHFTKRGEARWLSHRNIMDALERALRAAVFPVRYTEGFNPHIRLSMGPALPLGAEALDELFDVDCHASLTIGMVSVANRTLPPGVEITTVEEMLEGSTSLGKSIAAAVWQATQPTQFAAWPNTLDLAQAIAAEHGGAIPEGILAWHVVDKTLVLTLNASQKRGPTPSFRDILRALAVPETRVMLVPITRVSFVLENKLT